MIRIYWLLKHINFLLSSSFEDALEFIMAGATAIAVGTATFNNPYATVEIIDGIQQYMAENHIASIDKIRGIID